MKVLLINGSPHKEGCTYTALSEVAAQLQKHEIETEIFWIGNQPSEGVSTADPAGARAAVFSTMTASISASRRSSRPTAGGGLPSLFRRHRGGAEVPAGPGVLRRRQRLRRKARRCGGFCRRAGTTASLDALGKYFGISNMVTVGSTYWNMVHGHCPEDVMQDGEGLQTMRNLGRSMAWLLHCIQAGREAGYDFPAPECGHRTNFIR